MLEPAVPLAAEGGVLDPQGPIAASAETLWWLMFWLGLVAFLIFGVAMVAALFRRRRDAEVDEQRVVSRWIGGGGVLLPFVLIVATFGATLAAMRGGPPTGDAEPLVIELVGHQFWYEVHYPDAGIVTANEMHLPVGRPVEVQVTSADVIHSFWVPPYAGKVDLLPERTNTLTFRADESGEVVSRCAEFCGLMHARMALVVVAEPPDEFERWIDERRREPPAPTGAAASGQQLFLDAGCASCHAGPGVDRPGATGPDLVHLAERRTIGAGVLDNTRENAAAWIRDPHEIKPGVDMPATDLSDGSLQELLDYLGYDR